MAVCIALILTCAVLVPVPARMVVEWMGGGGRGFGVEEGERERDLSCVHLLVIQPWSPRTKVPIAQLACRVNPNTKLSSGER